MKSEEPQARRETVVFGFIGTVLDAGESPKRWEKWRPTVGLCQQPDFPVDRLILFCDHKSEALAKRVARDIAQVSPETSVILHDLPLENPWDFQEMYRKLYDWAAGYAWDPDAEDYLVHLTTGTHVAQICWFLLTEARYVPGRLLQSSPRGNRRSSHPEGTIEIIDLDLSRYDRLATRFAREQNVRLDFLKSGIATKNKAFNRLIEQIEQVARRSTAPILLTGPTGAGKSMLASRVYELRKTAAGLKGRFVEVNCATLRGDQAMSALFGHRRGAFTGAQSDRPGLLKEADGGLIFLDEVGELGLDEQAMLLRALEDKTFLPLGSDKPLRSDFQLIAGTNKDLREEAGAGRFREDLLARMNLWTFQLPGLAERREDIPANIDFELERFAGTHRKKARFNKEARQLFESFAHSPAAKWSANFRDLNAAVTRLATLAVLGRITVPDVKEEIGRLQEGWKRPGAEDSRHGAARSVLSSEMAEEIDLFDLAQLDTVIQVCRESASLSEAGRTLFSASRKKKAKTNDADRLKKYLARFGLDWGAVRARFQVAGRGS